MNHTVHPAEDAHKQVAFTIMIENEEKYEFIIKCTQKVVLRTIMLKLQKQYGSVLKDKQVFSDKEGQRRVNMQGPIQKSVKFFINLTYHQYESIIKDLFFSKEKPISAQQQAPPSIAMETVQIRAHPQEDSHHEQPAISALQNGQASSLPIQNTEPVPVKINQQPKVNVEYLSPVKQKKNEQMAQTSNTKVYPQTMQESSHQIGRFDGVVAPPKQKEPAQGKCCALI